MHLTKIQFGKNTCFQTWTLENIHNRVWIFSGVCLSHRKNTEGDSLDRHKFLEAWSQGKSFICDAEMFYSFTFFWIVLQPLRFPLVPIYSLVFAASPEADTHTDNKTRLPLKLQSPSWLKTLSRFPAALCVSCTRSILAGCRAAITYLGWRQKFGAEGLIIWKEEGGHPATTPKPGGSHIAEGAQRRGSPAAAASIFTVGSSSCRTPPTAAPT